MPFFFNTLSKIIIHGGTSVGQTGDVMSEFSQKYFIIQKRMSCVRRAHFDRVRDSWVAFSIQ